MTKLELIACRGLPGSGKSTWAVEKQAWFEANNIECVVVNKDNIRNDLKVHGWVWSHDNENDVIKIRDTQIREALSRNMCVISSDCNFGKHLEMLENLAKQYNATFHIQDFMNVDVTICIHRDADRPVNQRVGPAVIKEMYAKYVAMPDTKLYVADTTKPKAIICDLDGTLALFKGLRGPFDYTKVANDKLNVPVATIIQLFSANNYETIYLSGREDSAAVQTLEFLTKNNCPPGPLFMRQSKDYRKDFIVKQELFDVCVRNKYNVLFVLDDRNQVVNMWRRLGLTCLQVAEGNF